MNHHLLWQKLEKELHERVDAFPGVAGIALKDLASGQVIAINDHELFPTASTIKIHILIQLLIRAEAGEIDLDERVAIQPDQRVGGSGVLSYLDGPLELSLLNLANLMVIASDNTATNLCLERAGLDATNSLLRAIGLAQTHVRRKMMDHLAAVLEQENVSTPFELIKVFELLHAGQPSSTVAAQALTILRKPKHGFIDQALPEGVICANKPGWVERAMCDAALVELPRHPYLLAIMSKYAFCHKLEHEKFLVGCAQVVHQTMSVLDSSNQYGRSVYAS